eukprot:15209357-Alexandrium_andersonii.AAC.1
MTFPFRLLGDASGLARCPARPAGDGEGQEVPVGLLPGPVRVAVHPLGGLGRLGARVGPQISELPSPT